MEAISGLLAFFAMMLAFCAGVFLFVVQPVWSIVDVACSKRLSTGAKTALIVLTLVLLGPILTFFYALLGTGSRGLRRTTVVGAVLFAVGVGSTFGVTAIGVASHDETTATVGASAEASEPDLVAAEPDPP
jgi:uncharacterized BrkB/YihY/UPF0761 family membrane protein